MSLASRALAFIFDNYELSSDGKTLRFNYHNEFSDRSEKYQEIVQFPVSLNVIDKALLERLCQNLHLIIGISYWKLHCPPIKIPYSLSAEQAKFWQTAYTKGLGEFFYRNKLDWENLVKFPSSNEASQP